MAADAMKGVSNREFSKTLSKQDREAKRKQERAAYQDIKVAQVNGDRTEVSLDGNWLFMPDYQCSDDAKAALLQQMIVTGT